MRTGAWAANVLLPVPLVFVLRDSEQHLPPGIK